MPELPSLSKSRRSTSVRLALQTISALAVLVALPVAAGNIDHEPAPSVPSGERIEVEARIEDDAGVAQARLYFKATRETNFLFVGMERAPEGHVGTLPAPAPGTATVQYVVLYRNGGGELFRSPTYEVPVEARSEATAYAEPLDVYTELAEVPDAVAGFQDNLVLDVVESTARYGMVAGVDGASMPGSEASSGATVGTTATVAADSGGLGTLGVTAAVGAAVAGVAVAVASDESSSNAAPAFAQSGTLALRVPEGTTGAIGEPVAAEDPDGDDLTYSLAATDTTSFAVDSATGQLAVAVDADLDFETRADYAFYVVASDGRLSASRRVELTVTNVNERPLFDQSDTLALQVPEGTTGDIGDPAAANDPDGDDVAYSLSGEDAALFAVDATGQLSVPATTGLDFETRTAYEFQITVSDGELAASRPVEVAVTDVDEAPAFEESGTLALNVPEGATGPIGDPVAAADPEGDDVTYSLSGEDAALFAVDAAGQLSVPATTGLDFETRTAYEFQITVSDGELAASRPVEVAVMDVDEAPAFEESGTLALVVPEGATGPIGDPVAAADPEGDEVTYSLSGEDAALFAVDAAGQLSVPATTGLDFETRAAYEFQITVSDGELAASRPVEVAVTDVDEAPAFEESGALALVVPEGATGPIGDPVAAADPEGAVLAYSLSGEDAALFAVDAAGQLSVPATTELDFETRTDYGFDLVVSDGELTASRPVQVVVTGVDEAPAFEESGALALDVPEGATGPIGDPVAAADPEGAVLAYSLSGEDAALFAVDAAGQLSVPATTGLDFEDRAAYDFEITVSDGGLAASRPVEVAVTDVDEAPVFEESGTLALDVPEGATGPIGDPVAAADPEGAVLAYSLSGEDAALFAVDAAGQLSVPATTELDFETRTDYGFDLVVSDGELTASRPVEVAVMDVAEHLPEALWRDWLALRALYRATGGEDWDNDTNWVVDNEPESLDDWYGVTVSDGRVIRLALHENNLAGSIPAELGNLSNLRFLFLAGNRLTGSIPPELGNLSNLEWLTLSRNELTGSIPADLGNLSNLLSLHLHENELTGSIPSDLGNLSNLTFLLLDHNDLTGVVPEGLGNLTNLEDFLLNNNSLTGPLPDDLTDLTNLEWFWWFGQTVASGEQLCAPTGREFKDWLASISDHRPGPDCADSNSNPNAPRVAAAVPASSPGPDGTYTVGEAVEIVVRFDRPVSVSGAPRLLLGVGAATVPMALASASGNALVFRYEVVPGDVDLDGVSVGTAALRLDGGAVVGADGIPAVAGLGDHAFGDDPGHVVDAGGVAAERAVLEDALAAQARAHLASASDVLDGRFRAGPAQEWKRAVGALPGLAAARGSGNGIPGTLSTEARGGVHQWVVPCGTHARLGADCGASHLDRPTASGRSGFVWPGHFALRLGGGDDPGTDGATLWSAGDRRAFAGRTAAGGYDGDLRSRYLGVDRRFGGWLVGAAVSRSLGEAAYDFSAGTADGAGVLRTRLDVLLPYAGGRLADRFDVWGMAGLGAGDAALVGEDSTGEAGKLRLGLAAGGLRREAKDFGWLKLSVLADAGFARLSAATDQGRLLDGLSASVARFRAGVEGEHALPLAGGSLRPFWRATGRVDGGDGIRGTGLELAGGMRYGSPRVEAEVKGHWLAAGLAGSEEFGASATLRIKPLPNGTGLSASLSPRWGAADGGGQSVWEESAFRTDGWNGHLGSPTWSLDGQLGWGVALPRATGVFAPFVELRLRGSSTQRIGWRLERSVGASLLGVEFGVGRVERPQGPTGATELSLEALF